ncbi:MAG: AMP-binding protein [Promethearchaeota archaeon]
MVVPDKWRVDESKPWYKSKFWPKGVPHQLDYDYDTNLRDLLDQAVKNWADDPVMVFIAGGKSWFTYKEFKEKVDKFATYLASIGVKKGDVVAVHLPNCPQYVICYYAITSLGAIITGVNPTYKPLEILHQLTLTGAKYLVVLDALFEHFVKPIVGKVDLEKIIYTNLVDEHPGLSGIKKFLGKKLKKIPSAKVVHPKAVAWKDCFNLALNVPKVEILTEEDPATLIMTGGTTGVPKAAELTHLNVVANAMQCKEILTKQDDPSLGGKTLGHKTGNLGVLPLYHSFAMTTVMNTSIATGGWMILFPKPPPAEEILKEINELPNYNGFTYCAAEILFHRIAQLPDEVIKANPIKGKLKLCISGAGPLHDYVREPFEAKTGAAITEGYGLSEATPVVSCNNFFGERESGYIGVPAPGTDWAIFDAEDFSKGVITATGEEGTGEICVAGPQVMKGYWKDPEKTDLNVKNHGGKRWLLTGDIGFMDEHGRIAIRDRKKQLIKMSGHSVFPAEVESLIGQHEAVLEVAVAGLPDEKLGEAVKAWVALKPEYVGKVTAEEIHAWALENITRWKAPKYVEIIDEVPKNAIGKVMRRTLQEADPLYKAKQ